MTKLDDYLIRHAEERPEHDALVCGTECISYARLYERVREEAAIWASVSGKAVVVRATQSVGFIVTYLAVHLAGKTVVPLENDIPDVRMEHIEQQVRDNDIPEDVADILFTTGTTGEQKGVMISHRAIVSNAENLIGSQGYTDETVFVISGPLNHIGSLSKIWPVIMLGGTIVITEGMKNMGAFLSAFEYPSFRLASFLVPASLRMLIQFASGKLSALAGKIDFIETGAAPMSQCDMLVLRELLPHTRLYNTYASTETGIVSTYDYSCSECIAGCLGYPMKHASVFITEAGSVACKGPMLMTGYIGEPALTHSVLHEEALYTSDLGFIDSKGRLNLQGRMDDVINIGGYKISPVEVENQVLAYPGIKECICICAEHPVIGQVLKLLYVIDETPDFSQKQLVKFLKSNLEAHKLPFLYERVDKIERTYNGKINRNYYRI